MKKIIILAALFIGIVAFVPELTNQASAQVCNVKNPCYYDGSAEAWDNPSSPNVYPSIGIVVQKDPNGKLIAVIKSQFYDGGKAYYIYRTNKHGCNYYFTYDNMPYYFKM